MSDPMLITIVASEDLEETLIIIIIEVLEDDRGLNKRCYLIGWYKPELARLSR